MKCDTAVLNLLAIVALIVIFAYGWRLQQLKQLVLRHVRRACQQADVILLDETVAVNKFSLAQLLGRRTWVFEFTATGGERYQGHAYTQHHRFLRVELPPHRFTEGAP